MPEQKAPEWNLKGRGHGIGSSGLLDTILHLCIAVVPENRVIFALSVGFFETKKWRFWLLVVNRLQVRVAGQSPVWVSIFCYLNVPPSLPHDTISQWYVSLLCSKNACLSRCHLSPGVELGFCDGWNGSYSQCLKCSELLQSEKLCGNSSVCGCWVFFSLQTVSFPWFHCQLGHRSFVALGEEKGTVFLHTLVPEALEKRPALLCWARWGTSAPGLQA